MFIWLVVYLPPEKYEFVSWDDDIPNWMQSHKSHVPNHQPDKPPILKGKNHGLVFHLSSFIVLYLLLFRGFFKAL